MKELIKNKAFMNVLGQMEQMLKKKGFDYKLVSKGDNFVIEIIEKIELFTKSEPWTKQ